MTSRTTLFMLMALIFGAAAVFLARQWLMTQHASSGVAATGNVAIVVVAAKDIAFGTHLTADDLKEVNWPADALPQGAFPSKDKLLATSPVVIRRLAANEPVLPSKLSGPTARTSLSAQIGDSLRAVSVRVNDVVGVAGFILPGDRVDVMVTREIDKEHRVTDVVLQNTKVIGVDQNADEDASGAHVVKAVTLEVSPEQAQQLVLGSSVGELSLSLRNYLDVNSVPVRTVTAADLRYGGSVTPDAKPLARRASYRPAGASILVTRGTDSSVYRLR